MEDTKIRIAAPDDAAQLLDIYAPYVEKTAVSFEYTVPDLKEFADRITRILEDYPWLIAERNGKAAGYAYAGRIKDRAAYDWAVETTIYVREDQKRNGVGRALYQALEPVSPFSEIREKISVNLPGSQK